MSTTPVPLQDAEGRIWTKPTRPWRDPEPGAGVQTDLRSSLAWELLRTNSSLITGRDGGEDSCGRARLRGETPLELVQRTFQIVDCYLDEVMSKGGLRRVPEEKHEGD